MVAPKTLSEQELDQVEEVEAQLNTQDEIDRMIVENGLQRVRIALGNAKLKYHAAKKGLPGTGGHLNQHAEELAAARKAVEAFEEMLEEGIPDPGPLEIATEIPADVSELDARP